MSELKPCPFCGGHVDRATRKPAGMDVDFVINCQGCCLKFSPFCATEEDCERLWNLRHVLTQEAGPVVERKETAAPFGYWLAPKDQPGLGRFHRVTPDDAIIDSEAVVGYFDITPLYTSSPAPVAVVPDGWKLVPLSPTVEMRNAFAHQIVTGDFNEETLVGDMCGGVYTAMLAASPDACLDKVKELDQ